MNKLMIPEGSDLDEKLDKAYIRSVGKLISRHEWERHVASLDPTIVGVSYEASVTTITFKTDESCTMFALRWS
jgi:hypothetical protein